ncbi:MAG: YfhO family protein, partial [Spirochaetales bacterium]|nr:YfhO family protein [Spirochaetales bacterium]
YQYSYYRTPMYISYKGEPERKFVYCQPKDDYYVDIHNFVFNLGYSAEPRHEIKLTFSKKGIYSFDALGIYGQTFGQFSAQTDKLRRDVWEDVSFGTNRVYGTVDFSENRLLLVSVPYADGWKAFVDGRRVPILRGNIMNIALPMEKGRHRIELVYETPLLKTGFFISVMTTILFFGFVLIKKRRVQK